MRLSLPVKFNREEYSLEDLELFCTCTHYVCEHDGGLGGGDSICEVENCGCVSCEFDYDFTVKMHYFQGHYQENSIAKLTADTKKRWAYFMGGLPYFKEPFEMTILSQQSQDSVM
jgi:hypothetical protein